FSALIMAIVAKLVYNLLFNVLGAGFIQEALTLVVAVAAGALTYGAAIIILKVEEVNLILDKVKGKLNTR
ncbi:MAG: murein biosynthesis integral membrane protein MurJ, partial [Peptostreptococcaceae bacterium]